MKKMLLTNKQLLILSTQKQRLHCYENGLEICSFVISTAKNGLGEQMGSECTPRGWHQIVSIIGRDKPINSVFVAREWTGEIYSEALAMQYPGRDWILTCIMQLDGLEFGKNKGGKVDTLDRFIYIHGTPDTTKLGEPGSKGCIRMRNKELLILADWINLGTRLLIE